MTAFANGTGLAPTRAARAADARRASRLTLAIFLGPALLFYVALTIYPVLRTFYNSVHVLEPHNVAKFVGFQNFTELLTKDPVFWKAVGNTAIFTVVGTLADVAGGLVLALLLFARVPLAAAWRVIWFTPVL